MKNVVFVVIPNLNGAADLPACIDSVLNQSYRDLQLIIVDNGSHDNSKHVIQTYCEQDRRVRAVWRDKNYGYTGGVNPGLELAMAEDATYVAAFNNDAVADKHWLKELVAFMDKHPACGIAACKLLHKDGKTFDSTGDILTTWGLPYPRGRDEPVSNVYDHDTDIFGASGAASLYRVRMLKQIGVFDQDFFAYYEDIDLSFRAQLAGWKVAFVPDATVFHAQGVTSARIKGFATYQTLKNLPWVLVKNMPARFLWRVWPRFSLAYCLFFVSALARGQGWPAFKGSLVMLCLLPKKLLQRWRIQRGRRVSPGYIWIILTHDLPPNARRLRRLRAWWWRLTFKSKGRNA